MYTKTPPPQNPPDDCTDQNEHLCPNMEEYGGDMDTENYKCTKCNRRYKLYYDDMK